MGLFDNMVSAGVAPGLASLFSETISYQGPDDITASSVTIESWTDEPDSPTQVNQDGETVQARCRIVVASDNLAAPAKNAVVTRDDGTEWVVDSADRLPGSRFRLNVVRSTAVRYGREGKRIRR